MRRITLESKLKRESVCRRSLIANFLSSIYGTLGGTPDFGNGDPDADIYAK
jgi:hypothetical protein